MSYQSPKVPIYPLIIICLVLGVPVVYCGIDTGQTYGWMWGVVASGLFLGLFAMTIWLPGLAGEIYYRVTGLLFGVIVVVFGLARWLLWSPVAAAIGTFVLGYYLKTGSLPAPSSFLRLF